ncbi:MAG TPA: GNAT family N-acetyltransferase [Nakamurella sp.]
MLSGRGKWTGGRVNSEGSRDGSQDSTGDGTANRSTPALRALIRPMSATDWPGVSEIYAAGIATGNATFDIAPPDWAAFDEAKLAAHRHVALDADGAVLGWVAASAVSRRPVYRGVVEHSVYVHPYAAGRGVGTALLAALIESAEAAGIWTIQAGIFPENTVSLTLHARAGFRVVGLRERLGRHHGRWRDVILVERRSTSVGAAGSSG